MKLKTTCIYVTSAVAIASATVPAVSYAVSDGMPTGAVFGGGQAPPNASGGSALSVRVAGSLPQAAAEGLKTDLVNEGFTTAEVRQGSGGNYEVVLGGLTSRAQADALMEDLRSSGYTPDSIIEGAGAGSASTPAPTGSSVYRVLVAEFGSEAEANQASEVLVDDGFVNVDVVQEEGRFKLMLGTFNRQADAESLLTDVNRAGFALASVVSRERLRAPDAPDLADADLSGLSASEQQSTRDILAMADRVESGEATAEDIKQLRESIQQLSENQRAVIGRQESSRSADREKLQRIYQLYRDFQQALNARDYTSAEQALAAVRQIDPNDMFLQNRVEALQQARSGGSAAAGAGSSAVDPAEIQSLINEGRALESSGDPAGALGKFQQVLALDPTNVEARGKVADLQGPTGASGNADTGDSSGLMDNKPLVYGGAALLALIVIVLVWMKSRGRSASTREDATPSTGVTSFSMGDSIDPLGTNTPTGSATMNPTPAGGSAMGAGPALGGAGAAGAAGFASMHSSDEEDEDTEKAATPTPAPAPTPAVEESDTISLDDPDAPGSADATPPPAASDTDNDMVSLNFGDDAVSEPEVASAAPGASGSSMDADLESLLKGTFQEEPAAGDADIAAGAAAGAANQPTVVYEQNFDNETANEAPAEWKGEYDYASLTVSPLGEAEHQNVLRYDKPEGSGSATYHLSFPKATGRVTAEFDIRCDEKNKFLLGVYFECDEDFKQSVHTIVHKLAPDAPASLRIQGEAAPYEMGSWSHVRFEADLSSGTLDCFLNNDHVVQSMKMPVVPEYINTLSIRDNLATTGTLYLDNIRISEA